MKDRKGDETDDGTPLDKEPLTRESPSSGLGSSARWECPWQRKVEDNPAPLWDTAHFSGKAQEKTEVGAGRQDVRASCTQTPRCGGEDVQGATGNPTLGIHTVDIQQENELFVKWKRRGTGKLSHKNFKGKQWDQQYFHRLSN